MISVICGVAIIGGLIGGYMFTRRWQQQQADTEQGLLPYALAEPGQEVMPTVVGADSNSPTQEPPPQWNLLNAQEGLDTNLLAGTAPGSIGRRASDEVL